MNFFSLMGAVLAVCLAMVVGASFFAYKNLYFAGKVNYNIHGHIKNVPLPLFKVTRGRPTAPLRFLGSK